MTPEQFVAWKQAHGYSFRGLASALGVSTTTIERWASGESPISQRTELALKGLEQ